MTVLIVSKTKYQKPDKNGCVTAWPTAEDNQQEAGETTGLKKVTDRSQFWLPFWKNEKLKTDYYFRSKIVRSGPQRNGKNSFRATHSSFFRTSSTRNPKTKILKINWRALGPLILHFLSFVQFQVRWWWWWISSTHPAMNLWESWWWRVRWPSSTVLYTVCWSFLQTVLCDCMAVLHPSEVNSERHCNRTVAQVSTDHTLHRLETI